ncbi:DUF6578 domain-containing protein [Streptomyces halobius]|uniref:Uncharacterized protein n=1 Tax=Streptomyces halobius TaxID=2879846 RepID=A0ABY4MIH0_9ACTN|nr:DUF6578 domain-containing protein [Streptomyces halobius]UQA97147.1 hypothetical protein K9S39_39515 [Streptomyces halobius]
MELTVWVDDWQMQCCGTPFSIGSPVSWTLVDADKEWLADVVGADAADRVDGAEEHHGGAGEAAETRATVAGISAVHCRYAPRPGGSDTTRHPVPGSGTLTALTSADGWTPDDGERQFCGYLVELTGAHR